jgi:hypothetical protein
MCCCSHLPCCSHTLAELVQYPLVVMDLPPIRSLTIHHHSAESLAIHLPLPGRPPDLRVPNVHPRQSATLPTLRHRASPSQYRPPHPAPTPLRTRPQPRRSRHSGGPTITGDGLSRPSQSLPPSLKSSSPVSPCRRPWTTCARTRSSRCPPLAYGRNQT